MVESGMMNISLVFVLIIKSGIQEHVFLQELIVQMVEFGIQKFILVSVPLELSQILINVILFPLVKTVKNIILLIINVNVHSI
jgi:hypothetical protein